MDSTRIHDMFVIGGGISGCGIARHAAVRSCSVFLTSLNDLAGATASAATRLVHGGLRALQHCQFRLLQQALVETALTIVAALPGAARSHGDLGTRSDADPHVAKVCCLIEYQGALTSQDILRRRTKRSRLGDAIRIADLDQFLAALSAPSSREHKHA